MHLIQKKKELLLGTVVLVGFLCANAFVAHRQATKLRDNAARVVHTHEVLATLERLIATITNAETGQRGYLITGDRRYLEPYNAALATHAQMFERLRSLTADNRAQQERLPQLEKLIVARVEMLANGVRLLDTEGFEAARDFIREHRGKQVMDQVRVLVDEMQQDERKLLMTRDLANSEAYHTALLSSLLAVLLGLVAVAAFVWLLSRHLSAVEESAALVHEHRELLHAMLISIGDAVIATDAGGRVTFLNTVAQTLTGWNQDDACGRPLEDVFRIVNESSRQTVENPALRAIRDGTIVGLANHTILLSRDGREWPIDDSAAPIRTPRGSVGGAILVFREIGGRKRQEEEHLQLEESLQEVSRRKDEFLATLAHELRNPLAPISNALQAWPMVENDRAQMEQLREIMERQVQQMTRLIDDLLDVSRITRGKIELRRQHVDLATLISSAVETVQPLIAASGHQLTVSVPTDPILLDGDVARLTQVFGNILHNAAKYVGRNGVIRVTATQQDDHAVVSIQDNGPGIPANMLSQIFELFQQVDQTLDRSHGGLGIGLTLVKRLVDLHGGHIEARSGGPGRGSEFIVTLPISTVGPEADGSCVSGDDSRQTTGVPRLQILVVDDVQASAKTLAMMLRAIDQEVAVIHDGPAAIEWVLSHRPDLVFLDIAMPGMDGYEVARRIRRHDEIKETFLVALTGYGQEEDRRRAIEAGFNCHMTKPTSIDTLVQLLRTRPESSRSSNVQAAPVS